MAPGPAPDRVIVVGAGPVGLVAAACLIGAGIPVTVIEAQRDLPDDLRASTFHPPTLDVLARLGITDALIGEGLVCRYWQFRDRKQGAIATFDLAELGDATAFPYRLQCEQWKLARHLRAKLEDSGGAQLIYGARAVAVKQDDGQVLLTVEREDGSREELSARYLIGADGARSTIRRELGVAFEGMTIPELFLSLSTQFRYEQAIPDLVNINYISDPDEWLVLLRTPSVWRVLLPTDPTESDADMMAPARVEQRLQSVIASSVPYEVVHKTAYRVHERVAGNYVCGRVLLAGDAAHLNNPLGGMGMNGGIHDAVNLADKLTAVWRGADPSLLGRYERQRRKIAIDTVQAQALRNRSIMNERDPTKRQAFYDDLRATADDPARHRDYVMRSSMIQSLRDVEAVQ
jgi:3-(3-hydroxy-phenyl)propionate hydroxylase